MSEKNLIVEMKLDIERIKKDIGFLKERLYKMEKSIADIDRRLREEGGF